MTHEPRPPFTTESLRALAARARLVACALLIELAEWLAAAGWGRSLKLAMLRDVQRLTRAIAHILALLALRQMTAPPCQTCARRRANAPRGFRRARASENIRFAQRILPKGRTLRARLSALLRVLDDLDAWIVRMAARIDAQPRGRAFLIARAPCDACVALTAPAREGADTS